MRTMNIERAIEAYLAAAADVLPRHFRRDCCLNGTRVLVEVCRELGITCTPMATHALGYNATWVKLMESVGRWPTPAEAEQWFANGAWSVGVVGSTPNPRATGWPHHLIGVIHDADPRHAGYLVDSSSGQMSRPHKAMEIPWAIATPIDDVPSFLRGERIAVSEIEQPDGGKVVVTYQAQPALAFDKLDGFQRSPWNLDVANEITARVVHCLTTS